MTTDHSIAPVKVVYVGVNSGTCRSRYQALQKLEPGGVEFFDIDRFFGGITRGYRVVELLTSRGTRHVRANRELIAFCDKHQPQVVWVDKSVWVWPETLGKLRVRGAFLAHHFTDALFPSRLRFRRMFHLLRKSLPHYDLNFTSNRDDHAWMKRQGIRSELTYLGYDAGQFDNQPLPPDVAAQWRTDILFIGHYEPRTEQGILALVDAGFPVKVFGGGWHHAAHKDRLGAAVQYKPLNDVDYVRALKSARIGLCFVSAMNYNQTAGRTFEIPACGTFLLAMRTPQHLECYEEGREAEFFGDTEELVRKARHYLQHEPERQAIAERGHRRCIESDYSWERYMREDWAKVRSALKSSSVRQ